jgi:uncharacterized membrane protein
VARRRPSRSGGRDKFTGAILAVVGILLIGALAGGAWWLRKIKPPIDADNCPLSGPHAVHMIMIDRSDPISGQQAQRIRQQVEKLKNEAGFGTRFDVYTFEGDIKNEMQPAVRVCAPGRPEDANALYENPGLVRRLYDERFSAVLDRAIAELLQETTRANSPIIESLHAAAITSFGSINAGTIPLHVTLVSDMVQNTSLASHFKTEPNFAQLAKTSAWASLQPNLKRADVDILYLVRPNAKRGSAPIQNRGHQLFWEQLIGASGGRLESIEPM